MKDQKTCLITGATSGIGKAAALELARLGMQIIFSARDTEKARITRDEIIQLTGNMDIHWYHCDLASFESVKEFSDEVKKNHERLDILINNAGVWMYNKIITVDGIEYTFQVNHLAPFLLTHLLSDMIPVSGSGRIINVSSGIQALGYIDINDPEFKNKHFSAIKAYGQSKFANILFTRELANRLKSKNITVNCLAPGWVNTGLFRSSGSVVKLSARLGALTPAMGAETTIYLATSEEVKNISGEYFSKKRVTRSAKKSYDTDLMKKLWELSEIYVKDYLS
jgi:NAD(P)-dependent dehydrogenase (short-subunit alcohol dehydrogenase family)